MVAVAPNVEIRHRALDHLSEAGVQSSMHYPCIADFEAFANVRTGPLPLTREFVSRAVTLPLYPTMAEEDATEVCYLIGLAHSGTRNL